MRSSMLVPSRALLEAFRPPAGHPICPCKRIASLHPPTILQQRRSITTSPRRTSEMEVESQPRPRWAQTPPAMKAPVSSKPKPATHRPFKTNSDPAKLDAMYRSLLGKDGERLLSEETKWIAITHKSFDQGRRGFNDRLAYLGKRIIELQLSLGILNTTPSSRIVNELVDPHGREPFRHPALENAESLSGGKRDYLSHHSQFARLAEKHGLQNVVRWQPKKPDNLAQCGSDMVYAQAIFAIVGAISLERGGAVANEIVKDRILKPLGIRGELHEEIAAAAS